MGLEGFETQPKRTEKMSCVHLYPRKERLH